MSCEKQSRSQVAERDPQRDRPRDRSRERASEREKKTKTRDNSRHRRSERPADRPKKEKPVITLKEGRDPGQPPSILGQQLQTLREKLAPFHRDMICATILRSSQEDSVLIGKNIVNIWDDHWMTFNTSLRVTSCSSNKKQQKLSQSICKVKSHHCPLHLPKHSCLHSCSWKTQWKINVMQLSFLWPQATM